MKINKLLLFFIITLYSCGIKQKLNYSANFIIPDQNYKEDTTKSIFKSRTFDGIMKAIMSLRSINLTYNVTERTGLAGVIGEPGIFGMNNFYNSPGWSFIFGSQDSEIRRIAARNGWLVKNDFLNNPGALIFLLLMEL